MLNEVKHLSGAGGRKILHCVQADHWAGIGWAKDSGMNTRGCPPSVHRCHAERSEASLWAGSRKILHFVQDDNWAGMGSARDVAMDSRSLPRLSIAVILNEVKDLEVKHLSGPGDRRILHCVQDDNWDGIGRARRVAMTTRGRPRLSIPVMLNEVKHLSGEAAGRSFTSFRMTIGRGLRGHGKRRRPHGVVPDCPSLSC